MYKRLLLLLLLVATPCDCISEGQKAEYIEVHNKLRRIPQAADMMKMEWNDKLAGMADNHVELCVFEHLLEEVEGFQGIAQSVYRIINGELNITRAVNRWYSEVEFYDEGAVTCDGKALTETKKCGHYLQIVTSQTNLLGCSHKKCADEVIVVCNYSPTSGVTQRPYTPGSPCSKCPQDHHQCDEGLCY